jgi:hypothetical protein
MDAEGHRNHLAETGDAGRGNRYQLSRLAGCREQKAEAVKRYTQAEPSGYY